MTLAQALTELDSLARRLRRDCPWDREQTAKTIVPHTVEEAYEVADAALSADGEKLLDELGDLLYQTFFLSLLLEEEGLGNLETVAQRIHDKLVRRHPHIFAGEEIASADAVRLRWERIKREQEGREGIFHDVPEGLPSLVYARKLQRRAAAIEFEYPNVGGALADLDDEVRELQEAIADAGADPAPEAEPDAHVFEEVGDVLFAAVNVARHVNVDPELALRTMSRRFRDRVERAAQLAAEAGKTFAELPLDEQDRYFDEAKEQLR